jgi:hypothetical protein
MHQTYLLPLLALPVIGSSVSDLLTNARAKAPEFCNTLTGNYDSKALSKKTCGKTMAENDAYIMVTCIANVLGAHLPFFRQHYVPQPIPAVHAMHAPGLPGWKTVQGVRPRSMDPHLEDGIVLGREDCIEGVVGALDSVKNRTGGRYLEVNFAFE